MFIDSYSKADFPPQVTFALHQVGSNNGFKLFECNVISKLLCLNEVKVRPILVVSVSLAQLFLQNSCLIDSYSEQLRVKFADLEIACIPNHCLDKVLKKQEVRFVALSQLLDLVDDRIDQFGLLYEH